MSRPTPSCKDELRRQRVRDGQLNGIDYVDVSPDQRILTVVFMGKAPDAIGAGNVRIDGGRRLRDIRVVGVRLCIEDDPDLDDCMRVTVDRPGDFSTYTLSVVSADLSGHPTREPLDGFDPRYSHVDFSFKADCPSDLDCLPVPCPPASLSEPAIDYLAKDYASFRQLILDRLALIMPDWMERHVPDIGITLVELLSYVGDYLSYFQDAVATEAYLDTARQRISVHRHARLIDYSMHDGCNARTWVCVEVSAALAVTASELYFVTPPGPALTRRGPALADGELREVPPEAYEVFEPLLPDDTPIELDPGHNSIAFWTWGDEQCCLPLGATHATLLDEPVPDQRPSSDPAATLSEPPRVLHLKPGDVLILEEAVGPITGVTADADPLHRQAVRLTRVEPGVDALYGRRIVEVEWAPDDALLFPLCLSALGATGVRGSECRYFPVSVARGNVVLVDHGRSLMRCREPGEDLRVPPGTTEEAGCEAECEPRDPITVPPRFTPILGHWPVTRRTAFPVPWRVAHEQARLVRRIPELVHRRLMELWASAREGHALSPAELSELRTIFGERVLRDVRLAWLRTRRPRPPHPTPAEQADALEQLLSCEKELLDRKLRWLRALVTRADAGLTLSDDELLDIRDLWGDAYAEGLKVLDTAQWGPARDALHQDPRMALPVIRLSSQEITADHDVWTAQPDLLNSGSQDRHFVAEVDSDQRVHLRFGDGRHGRAVDPDTTLVADYRVGNATAGNLPAEVIGAVVFCTTKQAGITRVRNPLPAVGGVEPEPMIEVKLFAPGATHRTLQRAVTADDYAELAGRVPGVQRAVARLRWTGSWYEAQVGIDPLGTEDVDEALQDRVLASLFRYRRIGHDLWVGPARYVPLDLAMVVCVLPHYLRGHVEGSLLDALSNRVLPGGTRGYFHPDNLTFGDDVYVSKLVAVVQAVAGVESVQVTRLQRLGEGDHGELARGLLALGALEVAQLDNDPNEPEHGTLRLDVRGGR